MTNLIIIAQMVFLNMKKCMIITGLFGTIFFINTSGIITDYLNKHPEELFDYLTYSFVYVMKTKKVIDDAIKDNKINILERLDKAGVPFPLNSYITHYEKTMNDECKAILKEYLRNKNLLPLQNNLQIIK